jgi:hypothetical protein
MTVKNWKAAVVACFLVLFKQLPGRNEGNHENLSQSSQSLSQIKTRDIMNKIQEC